MLKICLVFWESEPQYAYKRYAYKKNMYLSIIYVFLHFFTFSRKTNWADILHGLHDI